MTYWNAFVVNLKMHGKGTFFDPRPDDASRFPIAAQNQMGHVHHGSLGLSADQKLDLSEHLKSP